MNPYELLYMYRMKDEFATNALIAQYMPLVVKIVNNSISGYSGLIIYREDLIQEGRIVMMDALECYRENSGSISNFISLVVRRKVIHLINHYNSRRSDNMHTMLSLDYMVSEDCPVYDVLRQPNRMLEPEYMLDFKNAQSELETIINQLSNSELLVMQEWINDQGYEEAAKRLGISKKSYDGKLQRLRKKLAAMIKH